MPLSIPSEFIDTVTYLTVDVPNRGRVPRATGFLVRVPIEGTTSAVDYVVTARHCIENARRYGSLYVRMNLASEVFYEVPSRAIDWYLSEDTDVAILPLSPEDLPFDAKPKDLNQASLKLKDFLGPPPEYSVSVEVMQVGARVVKPSIGSDLFFIGMFSESFGSHKNLPIVRFGHLSRMPGPVNISSGPLRKSKVDAYLAEFHSLDGHSGSPVFLQDRVSLQVQAPQAGGTLALASVDEANIVGFLGLVSGHYNVVAQNRRIPRVMRPMLGANSGIAIVTPAHAIRNFIESDHLREQRATFIADWRARHPPSP